MKKMKVSVIVPVWNVEKWIGRCIESVLGQNYDDLELIVVDDCTPDRSIDIVEKMCSQSSRDVRIVRREKNGGLSAARNSGIKVATGDCLYFLDSDDAFHSNGALTGLVRAMRDNDAQCVIGNYERISDSGESYVSRQYGRKATYEGSGVVSAYERGDIPVMAWNKLVSRALMDDAGLWFAEGLVNEDELWTFKLVVNCPKVVLTGEPTYAYYVRQGSIMTHNDSMRLRSSLKIYGEMVKCSAAVMTQLSVQNILSRFAFGRYLAVMKSSSGTAEKKEMYREMRQYQDHQQGMGSKKHRLLHVHRCFPTPLGFYVMKLITFLYSQR